jgi:hypothetical protein
MSRFTQSLCTLTTWSVGGIDLTHTVANYGVLTQKFWILNAQWQAFPQVVLWGQHSILQTWLLYTGPGGYCYSASNLHRYSRVAQLSVLHCMISQLNITTSMIYYILESREDHPMWLLGTGATFRLHELLWVIVKNAWPRYASLDSQPT